MGIEIERKFLVASDGWRPLVKRSEKLQQGYLASGGAVTVRVRLVDDRQGFLTIKSGGTTLARSEFEYEVPAQDARELLQLSSTGLAKVRHTLDLPGGEWVVDEFGGRHQGLLLAEVELESPDAAPALPDWLGAEVTGDPQYYNSRLAAVADGDR
jgi:adenylate cyclase